VEYMKRLKVRFEFIDDDGETIAEAESERDVPFFQEIEARGFRDAFHDIETAALELTKETRDTAVAEYLSEASKKKRSRSVCQEEPPPKRHM
jgi:hypothetical protein